MITNNCFRLVSACLFTLGTVLLPAVLSAQTPQWIWHPNSGQAVTNGEVRLFRKTFTVERRVQKATLEVAVDNKAEVFLNGEAVANAQGHTQATTTDVTGKIKAGENLLTVRGLNEDGPAALLVRLELRLPARGKQIVVSDTSWQTGVAEEKGWRTADFKPSGAWVAAVSVGKLGDAP